MVNPPLRWSHRDGFRWKVPIPGKGWSSPVTKDGRIWLTTAVTTPPTEEDLIRKANRNDFAEDKYVVGSIEFHAICIDLDSGKFLADVLLETKTAADPIHSWNTYASPTCALSEKKVICHFGTYGTWCLDSETGNVLWKAKYAIDHSVGPGSSPVIVDGVVILVCDGIDAQFVVGLSLKTGQELWKANRPTLRPKNAENRKAYCTPLIVDLNRSKQAVIPGAQWIVSYDPLTGKENWRVDHGEGFSTSPSPIFESETIVFSTGFMRPVLIGLTPYSAGEVPLSSAKWQATKGGPTVPSPLGYDGKIYSLADAGVLTCLDVRSGNELGKRRIGGKFSASPLLIGDFIYLCSHEGVVTIVRANTDMEVVATNEMEEQLMASPAVDREHLLIRGEKHLYCIP